MAGTLETIGIQITADGSIATREFQRLDTVVATVSQRIEAGSEAAKRELTGLAAAARNAGGGIEQAFGRLNLRGSGEIVAQARAIREALNQIRATGNDTDIARATEAARRQIAALRQEYDGARTAATRMNAEAAASGNAMASIATRATAAMAAAAAALSVREIVGALIEAQVQAQKLQASLSFSAGAANVAAELNYLRQVTNDLGLDFASASTAYAKFAASATASGVSLATVKQTFEGVAKAGAQFGLSAAEVDGAFLALSQMAAKGVVSMEELRGQLSERIPGAFSIAARAMGMSQQELIKFVESGKLLASDFLPKFAAELNKLQPPIETLQQEINRLNSAWEIWKRDFSSGSSTGMQWLTQGINESSAAMRALGKEAGIVHRLLVAIGGFAAGAVGSVHFDTAGAQARAMRELNEVTAERLRLERMENRNVYVQESINAKLRQEAALRRELLELATKRGREQGFTRPDLAGEFKAARQKEDERLKAYLDDLKNAPKAVKLAAEIEAENKAFQAAVVGLQETDKRYIAALAAHQQRVAEIKERNREKGPAAATEDADFSANMARLLGQLDKELAVADKIADAAEKLEADRLKSHQDWMKGIGDETAALLAKASAAEEENARIGLTAEQLAVLTAKRYDEVIAAREAEAAMVRAAGGREAEVALIETQIAALRRLRAADTQRPILQAQAKAAEDARREWERTSETIERSLTDALMRGFDSGKGFAESFRDSVASLFKTLILRPVIQAAVQPVAGAITGALGFGAQGAGGTAGNLLNGAGALNNAWNLYNGQSFVTGPMGQALGLSVGSLPGYAAATGAGAAGGVVSSATAAGASGIEAAMAGGAMGGSPAVATGLGSTVAAAAPWIAGALLLASVLGDKEPDTVRGKLVVGDRNTFEDAAGIASRYGKVGFEDSATENFSGKVGSVVAQGLIASLDKITAAFGDQAGAAEKLAASVQRVDFGSLDGTYTTEDWIKGYTANLNRGILKAVAGADLGGEVGAWLAGEVREVTRSVTETVSVADYSEQVTRQIAESSLDALTGEQAGALVTAIEQGWIAPLLKSMPEADRAIAAVADRAIELATKLPALAEQYGLSAQSIGQAVTTALSQADAASAGASLANSVLGGIYGALQQQYATQIGGIFQQSIINPILVAVATGADLSTALAEGVVEDAITKITAVKGAYEKLLADERFAKLMDDLGSASSRLATNAWVAPAWTPPATAAESPAAQAADDAARAAADLLDRIRRDADATRRQIARLGMDDYTRALDDLSQRYREQAAEIARLATGQAAATGALDDWAAAQRQLILVDEGMRRFTGSAGRMQQALADINRAWGVFFSGAADVIRIRGGSPAEQAALVQQQIDAAVARYETAWGRLAGAERIDALDELRGLVVQRYDLESAGIEKARDAARALADDWRGVAERTRDWLDGFAAGPQSPLSAAAQDIAARDRLQRLVTAAAGGDARAAGQVTEAADVALDRARAVATSVADYARMAAQIRAQVASVTGLADTSADAQTRIAEQGAALNAIQTRALADLDRLGVILGAVHDDLRGDLDRATAETRFWADTVAALGAGGAIATAIRGLPGEIAALIGSAGQRPPPAIAASAVLPTGQTVGQAAGVVQQYVGDQLAAGAAVDAVARQVYDAATASGISSAQTAAVLQQAGYAVSQADVLAWAAANGLPMFATGGIASAGAYLAGERGPELITSPVATRIFSADDTRRLLGGGTDTRRLEALIEALEKRLARIEAATASTARHTSATASDVQDIARGVAIVATKEAA